MGKKTWYVIETKLKQNTYFSTEKNNFLFYEYVLAKKNGGYSRLIFEKQVDSDKTLERNAMSMRKFDSYFKKDFDLITESDLIKFRDDLNDNKIFKNKTKITKEGVVVEKTSQAVSYRSKRNYKNTFCEFWRFLKEFIYQTEKRELKDITIFFKIRKPNDFQHILVDYIPHKDIFLLLDGIKNPDFKALLELNLMSGGRVCEILKVKFGDNLYQNEKSSWVIHLPKIKKVSYAKFPFEIDMYEDHLIPWIEAKSRELKKGDYVFKTTEGTFRKLLKYYSEKILKRAYSPKILRKSARMIRTNAGYSHDWINKFMGHAPGSDIQAHYTNYEGIENDQDANDKLKGQQYPGLKREFEQIKMEKQAQEQKIIEMTKDIEIIKNAMRIRKNLLDI